MNVYNVSIYDKNWGDIFVNIRSYTKIEKSIEILMNNIRSIWKWLENEGDICNWHIFFFGIKSGSKGTHSQVLPGSAPVTCRRGQHKSNTKDYWTGLNHKQFYLVTTTQQVLERQGISLGRDAHQVKVSGFGRIWTLAHDEAKIFIWIFNIFI